MRRVVLALLGIAFPVAVGAEIRFEVASASLGAPHSGLTHGVSWGDFNGDGFPDIWSSNHWTRPSLYLNQGDGTFVDIVASVWPGPFRDAHGAAWADFDDDGDQDLMEMVGGAYANHLWINEGGVLVDEASALGVGSPGSRGRTPLWLDYNGDGLLDLVHTQLTGSGYYPQILKNTGSGFVDASPELGNTLIHSYYAQLADLTGDGRPELVIQGYPFRVYEIGPDAPTPLVDILPFLGIPSPGLSAAQDTLIADLTGDGRNDVLQIKQGSNKQLVIVDDFKFEVKLTAVADEQTVRFISTGRVTLNVYAGAGITPSGLIRIGASGTPGTSFFFTLDPSDPGTWGIAPHTPGAVRAFFVGVDPATSTWTVSHSSTMSEVLNLIVTSVEPMTQVTAVNFDPNPPAPWPNYYRKTDGGYEEYRVKSGLSFGMPCNSLVAADFDNDMDLDVYLACARAVSNADNLLLENAGNGTFRVVPDAGGAKGSSEGRSESVATADYDQDGFVDLFLTNGHEGLPFADGPHELFRNLGNGNHWLEIDLEGTVSNREAIGAVVQVTAGGVTQTRIQDGGMHRFSQNHKRLHFGLAANTRVESVRIEWPSGRVRVLRNVLADQILGPIREHEDQIPILPFYAVIAGGILMLASAKMALRGHGSFARRLR